MVTFIWLQEKTWGEISHGLELWRFIISIAFSLVQVILSTYLYFRLRLLLSKNLYFYYQKQKRMLWSIYIANVGIVLSFMLLISSDFGKVSHHILFEKGKTPNIYVKVLWLITILLSNSAYCYLIYFNVKNINYKLYLKSMYGGLRINEMGEGSSIFIKNSCFASKYDQMDSNELSDSDIPTPDQSQVTITYSESEPVSISQQEAELNEFQANYRRLSSYA